MNNNIVELNNVVKKFGKRTILNGIDLSIHEGELITIMGKSGAGKSTLLNILGFLETMTSGVYKFDGRIVKKGETEKIRNLNIGFVFQSYNLISKLTVYENIALPIYYSLASNKEKKEYIKKIPYLLKKYNIEEIKDSYVDYISGGEKQRVCLARALSCNARLIISDEPTGNLDQENATVVLNELKKMNEEGKTVIIVTHDETVQNIADRKLVLKEGKMIQYDI